LTVLVSQKISDIIAEQRQKTGATVTKVVESAIMTAYGDPKPMVMPQAVKAPGPVDLLPDVKPKEPEYSLFDAELMNRESNPGTIFEPDPIVDQGEGLPDYHGKELTVEERDDIVLRVAALITGNKCAERRAEVLNKAGITTKKGKPWVAKKLNDAVYNAGKRLKKRTEGK